eukprot:Gregarina_sp_Poly_1__3468@NODE_2006_length_2876_cov_35_067996_g1296_i0_p1_GENE_NODE_2006_length_2876_cov_35_067996_g1296_i0NODE_2006_length_2876_cov_35_067996_g1296_i0_p1_ORF_typecomplete_len556_score56_73_NODE_2006_length_2876_cov_35_067996_g1296_i011292796
MFGASAILSGTISWLSSSTQLISGRLTCVRNRLRTRTYGFVIGAVKLSERISQLLLPASSTFTIEERQLLFIIQSYLLGISQPLKLCGLWSRHRTSCVLPLVVQVEDILRDAMLFIHPLLMGQRPIAAAHYIQNRAHNCSTVGPPLRTCGRNRMRTSTETNKRNWSSRLHQSDHHVRASLRDRLAESAERLSIALALLNTALSTIQACDILYQTINAPPSVCLVTLLSSFRHLRATERCTGDLMSLNGQLLIDSSQWDSATASQGWHRISASASLRVMRQQIDNPPNIQLKWKSSKKFLNPCIPKGELAGKLILNPKDDLQLFLDSKLLELPIESSLLLCHTYTVDLFDALNKRSGGFSQNEALCDCLEIPEDFSDGKVCRRQDSGKQHKLWEVLVSSDESMADTDNLFEQVAIDEGDPVPSSLLQSRPNSRMQSVDRVEDSCPLEPVSILHMADKKKTCVVFQNGILQQGSYRQAPGSGLETPQMAFVIDRRRTYSNHRGECSGLEFVYFSRLLTLCPNSANSEESQYVSEDWLDEVSHEMLVEMFASASTSAK